MPDGWRAARATFAIAAITALCWLILSFAPGQQAVEVALAAGFTPDLVSVADAASVARLIATPLTATLIHGGMLHLLVTMLGLLVCGRIVETIVGKAGMIILYLAGAYVSAAAYYAVAPNNPFPMIGAGGAVAAVIGAYALLLGRNKLRVAGPRRGLWLNALWLGAAWVAIQVMTAFAYGIPLAHYLAAANAAAFLAGLALAKPLLMLKWRGA